MATPPPISPQMMQSAYARPPGARTPLSGVGLGLMIVVWLVWLGVSVVADFLAFLMFAFADSPGSAGAAQMMIVPAFAWFGFTFVAGAVLLFFRRWWGIAIAFVLAISPPFMVFVGYNLLSGSSSNSSGYRSNSGPPSTMPAIPVQMPPGGFVPPPMKTREQPDFQKLISKYRDEAAAATRPADPAATTQP